LLSKVLYRSAAIAPIISARILKMIGKDNDGRQAEKFDAGYRFSNPIKNPKKCKQASPGDTEYYSEQCLNYQLG
jgi:hypothetical protein